MMKFNVNFQSSFLIEIPFWEGLVFFRQVIYYFLSNAIFFGDKNYKTRQNFTINYISAIKTRLNLRPTLIFSEWYFIRKLPWKFTLNFITYFYTFRSYNISLQLHLFHGKMTCLLFQTFFFIRSVNLPKIMGLETSMPCGR